MAIGPQDRGGLSDHLFDGVSGHVAEGPIDRDDSILGVGYDNALAGGLENLVRQQKLLFSQPSFVHLLLQFPIVLHQLTGSPGHFRVQRMSQVRQVPIAPDQRVPPSANGPHTRHPSQHYNGNNHHSQNDVRHRLATGPIDRLADRADERLVEAVYAGGVELFLLLVLRAGQKFTGLVATREPDQFQRPGLHSRQLPVDRIDGYNGVAYESFRRQLNRLPDSRIELRLQLAISSAPLVLTGGRGEANRLSDTLIQVLYRAPQLLHSDLTGILAGRVAKRHVRAEHHPANRRNGKR
ncbi:MAG: hypothetical protein QGG42_00780 [Phycisphaerae bacterium]|nr:hypothetical protein [Phycisphaerae bacterium]